MSARYRGTSPNHNQKVISKEAEEASKKASEAFRRRNAKKQDLFSQYGYHIVIGGFILLLVFAFGNTFFSKSRNPEVTPVIEQDEIDTHNGSGYSFTLGSNAHFDEWMLSDAKATLNAQLTSRQNLSKCATSEDSTIIPDAFDFRKEFPKCVRSEVYSQGKCSASYATVAASTIADRLCRVNPEQEYVELSAQTLIDCDTGFSMGCQGGYVQRGFDYAKKNGLPLASEFQFTGENATDCSAVPQAQKQHIEDSCFASEEEGIKREIYTNGPVATVLPIYRDFLVYKDGIYQVLDGVSAFRSGQAVKIIGWDKDSNGRSYWIVENSWGPSWGINGYAHIYTQQEQLHLDDAAVAPIVTAVPEPAVEQTTD